MNYRQDQELDAVFNVPLLGPDPTVAETICSRSFLKSVNGCFGKHTVVPH